MVLVGGGGRHCWVGMCSVGCHIQNDWEQQICIKFCVKLEHSSMETLRIQKAAAVDNGEWQLHHDNASAHASHLMQSFLVKHQITQVTQSPYSTNLAPWDFWLFRKLKALSKGKRFQTVNEIQANTVGQLMAIWRTVWGPKVPTLKGTEVSLSYV